MGGKGGEREKEGRGARLPETGEEKEQSSRQCDRGTAGHGSRFFAGQDALALFSLH
jgi:hypothetical protein